MLLDDYTGFDYEVQLAAGRWADVANNVFQQMRDLEAVYWIGLDTADRASSPEQKDTAKRVWKLALYTVRASVWSWATETHCPPNCFLRIFSDTPQQATEYNKRLFHTLVQATLIVQNQDAHHTKVKQAHADTG